MKIRDYHRDKKLGYQHDLAPLQDTAFTVIKPKRKKMQLIFNHRKKE